MPRTLRPAPPPEPAKPPRDADGVQYTEAHGLKLFRCEPHQATLSQRGCGDRWREAQVATSYTAERLLACRGCAIGAAHAGEAHIEYSKLYGERICSVCRRGSLRMIHGRSCPSCYNRRRELRANRNARGNIPIKLLEHPLRTVAFQLSVDGQVRRVRAAGVRDLLEPMIQTLRTTKGAIAFGFQGTAPARSGMNGQ